MGFGRWALTAVALLAVAGCGGSAPGGGGSGTAGPKGLTPPVGSPVLDPKYLPAVDGRLASMDITLSGAYNGTVHQKDNGKCGVDAHGDVAVASIRGAGFAIGSDVFDLDVTSVPEGFTGTLTEHSDAEALQIQAADPHSVRTDVDLGKLDVVGGQTLAVAQWHGAPGTQIIVGKDGGSTSADMQWWQPGGTKDPHQKVHVVASWHCRPRPAGSLPSMTVTTTGFLNGTFKAIGVELDWCVPGTGFALSSGNIQVGGKGYNFYADPGAKGSAGTYPMVAPSPSPAPGNAAAEFYLLNSNEENFTLRPGSRLTISPDGSHGTIDAKFTEAGPGGYTRADMTLQAAMTCGRSS